MLVYEVRYFGGDCSFDIWLVYIGVKNKMQSDYNLS